MLFIINNTTNKILNNLQDKNMELKRILAKLKVSATLEIIVVILVVPQSECW